MGLLVMVASIIPTGGPEAINIKYINSMMAFNDRTAIKIIGCAKTAN